MSEELTDAFVAALAAPPTGAIDHVAIAVRDADEAARTFARLLGHRMVGDERVEAAGVRLVYLGAAAGGHRDAALLQLVQPVAAGAVAEFVAARGEGLHHVCFRTSNIERSLRAAGERGTGGVFAGGRGRPCAFLTRTAHGVLIELTELSETSEPTTATSRAEHPAQQTEGRA